MGIPKTSNEDTDKITTAIAKKISAEIDIDQADRRHRVGLKKDGDARPIIVKFTSYCAKAELTSNRRKLATVSGDKLFPFLNWPLRPAGWNRDRPFVHRIFINDDLTKARAGAARPRSLRKAGKIKDLRLRGEIVSNIMSTRSWGSSTSRILMRSMPNCLPYRCNCFVPVLSTSQPFEDAIVKAAAVLHAHKCWHTNVPKTKYVWSGVKGLRGIRSQCYTEEAGPFHEAWCTWSWYATLFLFLHNIILRHCQSSSNDRLDSKSCTHL